MLPTGRTSMIRLLWWTWWGSIKYLRSLLNGEEYALKSNKKQIKYREGTLHDIYRLFHAGKITEADIYKVINDRFSIGYWNKKHAHEIGIKIPGDIDSLLFDYPYNTADRRHTEENDDHYLLGKSKYLSHLRAKNVIHALNTKPESYFKIRHKSPDDDTPA
jgi:hypothetical protein